MVGRTSFNALQKTYSSFLSILRGILNVVILRKS